MGKGTAVSVEIMKNGPKELGKKIENCLFHLKKVNGSDYVNANARLRTWKKV